MTVKNTQKQQRLLVLPPSLPAGAATTLRSLTLPHPRTAAPTTYLSYHAAACTNDHDMHLLSLDLVSNPQSAFINNTVHQSGSYLLATPFDPTFLLLHLLATRASTDTACLVDDLLHSPAYPDLAVLAHAHLPHIERLLAGHLCTAIPITPDQSAFRLDKAKVTQWLAAKVQSLAAALAFKGASHVYPPLPSPQVVGDDQWAWTRYAMTLVSEWLTDERAAEWMQAVAESLGVPKVQVTPAGVMDQLVAASVAGLGAGKEADEGGEGGSAAKKKAKTSAAASKKPVNKAAGIKVPKGQKSVAAFFAKKT